MRHRRLPALPTHIASVATSTSPDAVERAYALIAKHMDAHAPKDAGELVATLQDLCDAMAPDHGAEVVERARALWLERTRVRRLAMYCPAEGYGGVR